MPNEITINANTLRLSPEFAYVHAGGDIVYYGDDQGVDGITDESTLSEGDVLDSPHTVFATCVGEARLNQYAHNEPLPEKPKPKKSAKKGK